jgi:hypothetical protein
MAIDIPNQKPSVIPQCSITAVTRTLKLRNQPFGPDLRADNTMQMCCDTIAITIYIETLTLMSLILDHHGLQRKTTPFD